MCTLYESVEAKLRERLGHSFSPTSAWQAVRDMLREIDKARPPGLLDYGVMFEVWWRDNEPGWFQFSIQFAFKDAEGEYIGMEMVSTEFRNVADLTCEKKCFDLWLDNEKELGKIVEAVESSSQYSAIEKIKSYESFLHAGPV